MQRKSLRSEGRAAWTKTENDERGNDGQNWNQLKVFLVELSSMVGLRTYLMPGEQSWCSRQANEILELSEGPCVHPL
jgi:hypothetical protein